MENLIGYPLWSDVVLLETETVALGGEGGPMNAQAQALLNRFTYLQSIAGSSKIGYTSAFEGVEFDNLGAAVQQIEAEVAGTREYIEEAKVEIQGYANEAATQAIAEVGANFASDVAAAEAARLGAEVASEAAILAVSSIYASTTAGIAGTTNGQYFYVVGSTTAAALGLYLNNAGTADFKKSVPTSLAVQGVERAMAAAAKQPNLFDHAEARALSKDRFTTVTGTLALETYSNEAVYKITTNGSGSGRFYRRFLRSEFGSATAISAAVDVMAMDAGTTATFNILQRNSGGTTIVTTTATIGSSAISTPTTYRNDNISLHADCVYVDFDLVCNKTSGDFTRNARYRNLVLCVGSSSYYREPAQFAVPNYFPDVDFFGFAATTFDGARAIESNELVLNLSSDGATAKQAIYQMAATGIFAPGNYLTLVTECYCNTTGASVSADVTVIFYNSSAAEISRTTQANASSSNAWHELRTFGTIPANTAYFTIRFVGRTAGTTAKFRRVYLTNPAAAGYGYVQANNPGSGRNVQARTIAYVATTGSDATGDGSKTNPFATITRGVKAAKPDGIVVIRGGEYNEAVSLAGCLDVDFIAYPNERVRINRGTLLASFSKTAGRTYVYQCALNYDPATPWIWEHEVPDADTEITAAERLPIQRGEAYRLPSTRLHKKTSIAEVDAATGGAYYWDGATTIYIRTPDGSNPASNGQSYYVPSQNSGFYGGTGNEVVRISDIDVWYCQQGVNGGDTGYLELNNVFVFGSRINGVGLDEARVVRLNNVRAAGNGNDGINGHNYNTNDNARQMDYLSHFEWCHDNGDDGQSYHENGMPRWIGGLWEYNGDRGIATSYGAHGVCIGGIARHNGQLDYNGGEGFCAIGVGGAIDPGIGTQMECVNCLSYGNLRNYLVSGDAANKLIARNCASRDALAQVGYAGSGTGYYASQGLLVAYSCTSDGDVTTKATASGGSITVNTGTPLA